MPIGARKKIFPLEQRWIEMEIRQREVGCAEEKFRERREGLFFAFPEKYPTNPELTRARYLRACRARPRKVFCRLQRAEQPRLALNRNDALRVETADKSQRPVSG